MPSLICVHTLHNNTNINTKVRFQNFQYYMCTYFLKQQKDKHKVLFPKFPVLNVYIPSKAKKTQKQRLVSKRPSLTYVNTLYKNTNINTKACCQKSQYYMRKYPLYTCTHPLQQQKYKHKVSFPKVPVLHVYIPSTKTQTQRLFSKIISLICVHTLYKNTNKNIKNHYQKSQYSICTYPLQ